MSKEEIIKKFDNELGYECEITQNLKNGDVVYKFKKHGNYNMDSRSVFVDVKESGIKVNFYSFLNEYNLEEISLLKEFMEALEDEE